MAFSNDMPISGIDAASMKAAETGADKGSVPGSAANPCTTCDSAENSECANKIEQIQKEATQISSESDPIERNKLITAAYTDLSREASDNRWINLASVVSSQGGCAMKEVAKIRSYFPSIKDSLDSSTGMSFTKNMYRALGDANKAIFSDIYPMAAYQARYGYEDMKKCYAATGKKIPNKISKSFESLENGNLRQASDLMADYEQRDVVQNVYDDYKGTFTEMSVANVIQKPFTGSNLFDIPVSTDCGDTDKVPFVGSISNPDDRVGYYNALMDKLSTQQGWSW